MPRMQFWRPLRGVSCLPMSGTTGQTVDQPAASTKVSEVTLRCARIRASSAWRPLLAGIVGYSAGALVIWAELFVIGSLVSLMGNGVSVEVLPRSLVPLRRFVRHTNGAPIRTWLLSTVALVLILWLVPQVHRWWFERRAGSLTWGALQRRRRSRGWWAKLAWAGGFLLLAVLVAAGVAWDWRVAFLAGSVFAAKSGTTIVCVGMFGRRGKHVVCARCDFPMRSWRGGPETCPECDHAWHEPWHARYGRRRLWWKWVLGGTGLLVASALMLAAVMQKLFV